MKLMKEVVLTLTMMSSSWAVYAADFDLTSQIRAQIVDLVIEQLQTGYVLPARGAVAAAELRHRFDTGYFDDITSPQVFANRITGVLDVISDWHLWVNFQDQPIPEDFVSWRFSDKTEREVHLRRRNFGFEKVERLSGNVGYIELREFYYEESVSERALADVMHLMRFTDGLIIDLRRNGGGDPAMVDLLASYFLAPGVHLGDIQYKEDGRLEASYTQQIESSAHYGLERPVHLLLSENTFSGAEGFSYTMQVLGRMTLIGERTKGGAHLFEDVRLHAHFMMALPIARSINPVTKSSWQYVGVRPDIEVPAEQALHIAQKHILEELIANSSDSIAKSEQEYALRLLGE